MAIPFCNGRNVLAYQKLVLFRILIVNEVRIQGLCLHHGSMAAPEVVAFGAPFLMTACAQRQEVGRHAGLCILLCKEAVVKGAFNVVAILPVTGPAIQIGSQTHHIIYGTEFLVAVV